MPKSSFLVAIGRLVSASFVAQFVTMVCMVVIARQYSPADYGIFAFALSICTVLSVMASGRYELGVMNAWDDFSSSQVIIAALLLATVFTVVVCAVAAFVILLSDPTREMTYLLLLSPVIILVQSVYQITAKWANRQKQYYVMSVATIILAAATSGAQIGLGALWPDGGARALATGYVLGHVAALSVLGFYGYSTLLTSARGWNTGTLSQTLREYWRFPAYTLPHSVASKLVQETPVFFLNTFFGGQAAGLFALTRRVLSKPVQLLGQNVGYVFHQRIADIMRARPSEAYRFSLRTTGLMAAMALPICIVIIFAGRPIFLALFGPAWQEAAVFAQILLPIITFRLMAIPVAQNFIVCERQGKMLSLQILHLGVTAVAYGTGAALGSIYWALALHAIGSSAVYAVIINSALGLSSHVRDVAPARRYDPE